MKRAQAAWPTVEKVHEPIFAPIQLEVDVDARKARLVVPGITVGHGEPIVNPVTRQQSRARIELPDGFEYTVAEMGRVAEPFALPPGEWDVLGSFPATLDSAYQTVVGTLCDSTGAGLCATTFLVRGITDQVGIVPQHIWTTAAVAAHPDTWADANPVGTGPFKVSPCGPNNIQYVANPNYWQAGKPYIQKIVYPGYLDNGPGNRDLAGGKGQWGSQFIPNIKQFYLSKSPDNHTWSPPVTNVEIFPNLDPSHPQTSKLAVRQAISMAIDRNKVSQIGEDGQQPPANQTGIILPTFNMYYDASAVAAAGYDKPNVDKAKSLMASAGYSPSNPLKLTIITITGYTDWDASLAVIKQNLASIGIDLTVQDLAQQTFNSRLYTGDFDLAYYGEPTSGPSPYYELRQILYSKNTAPIGKSASTNYERYINPAVDALFDQYPSADSATQVSLIKQIGQAMLNDVPIIPTTESVDWFQYNTKDIAGWPTPADPYAQPAAFNFPDAGQVLLHLYSKSAQ